MKCGRFFIDIRQFVGISSPLLLENEMKMLVYFSLPITKFQYFTKHGRVTLKTLPGLKTLQKIWRTVSTKPDRMRLKVNFSCPGQELNLETQVSQIIVLTKAPPDQSISVNLLPSFQATTSCKPVPQEVQPQEVK